MQNLEQIKDFIWETDYYNEFVNSKRKKTCLICGKKVSAFKCEKVKRRYKVTALCEDCQRTNIK